MTKRLLVFGLSLLLLGILAANSFYPKLYVLGYNPVIDNKVLIYKYDKGLNQNKSRPYYIPSFAPTKKETVDFENRKVKISTQVDNISIYPDVTIGFDSYFDNLKRQAFRKSLRTHIRTQAQQTQVTTTGLIKEFVIDLPSIAIPRAVQKVLGSSAGRLNLDGTQKLTLEAGSTKRKKVPLYDTVGSSRFDLKMEQETNLRLSGTIGDKIGVNMKYNSKQDQQLFDPNNVNIKYTGTEDEVIKSIEAGNIALSLSGSRYISYSTSSQGLFGVTSKFKYGDLEITAIASKEEGQKNTQSYIGKSQADSTIFRSKDYAPRTMYYLHDPYELYALYTPADAGPNVPNGWINNAIKTNPSGAWLIAAPLLLPKNGSVKLYIDDAIANNNVTAVPGDTIYFSQFDYYVPYYNELIQGTDFITDYSAGIIQLNVPVDRRTTLAVRYVLNDGLDTPVPFNSDVQDGVLHAKVIRRRNQEYDPQDPNNVWNYQMRNVFKMNKTNIRNDGFSLQIYTENVDRTRNYLIPDSLAVGGIITYDDYLRMDSNGDGLVNGDDSTVNLSSGMVSIPYIEPFYPLGDVVVYQYEQESVNYLDMSFFMLVKGKIGRDAVDLAQGGILKGSVQVRVNGNIQKENVDYLVDYDFGRITFLTPAGKDPDAKIEIDYEFRSMFDVSRKTLAGVRTDWNITDFAKLGGTFIYRSENVSDKRPRIGSENIEMIMTNVDGNLSVKPAFVTRWLDALPFIKATGQSSFTLSGEIAYTIPSIYGDPNGKKKVAYIDDMESIVDSYPMGVTISAWAMGSKPWGTSLAKGRPIWYNPKNVRREQIEDPSTLTEREKKETVTVLALKVFPSTMGMPGSNVWSWGGVMKYLGNQLDFSQKKYLEILLKVDVRTGEPIPNPILRIDLGDINEDFYTEYGGLNVLNNEDKNSDGVLILDEDTGLDGIRWGEPGHDPNDKASNEMDQLGDYPYINNTEGNRVLDTEDLDGNGVLNQLDRYFSYTISLTDSLYLENINHDGWRLYRIPLTDPNAYQIVNNSTSGVLANLKKISFGRIMLETDVNAKVLIADVSVVGNKWQDFLVRYKNNLWLTPADMNFYNTSYISGIVNNQKNRSHYTSPEGTVYIEDRRESSESALTLNIQNLHYGHQVLLRQRSIDSFSLLSYGKIKFWVYPEASDISPIYPDSINIVFRIGADSLHYYEIRERVPVNPYMLKMDKNRWMEFTYDLQQVTALKQNDPTATHGEITIGTTTYGFRGTPTLTNVRDVYLGVLNPDDTQSPMAFSGTLYYNDLRVAEPYEDIGIANRISLSSVFADLSTLSIDFEEKSENFNPVIQRGRSNTFTRSTTFNISNKYFLNKFFPQTWSLDIPVTLTRSYTLGIPRYRANSDLLRENITDPAEKERERSESLLYAAEFGFSQRTAPKNKILLYSIYRSSLSGRIENSFRHTPTAVDTTFTWRGTYNYNIGFPSDKVSLKLFKNYRLGFFPTTWNNSFTLNKTDPKSWNWELRDNVYSWRPRAQVIPTFILNTDTNINWGLTSDIAATIRLNSKRDLIQEVLIQKVNVGKLADYTQDLGLNFNPNYLRRYFNFTASGTTRFAENQRKYFENTPDGQIERYQSDGSSNRTLRTNLTLMNSNLLGSWAENLANRHNSRKEAKSAQSSTEDQKKSDTDKKTEEDLKREEERKREEQNKAEESKTNDPSDPKADERSGDPGMGYPENRDADMQAPPAEPGKPYTPPKGVSFLPATMIGYLSKIKNVTASYQNTYTMNYTRKDERPPFAFQIGLPHSVPHGFLDSTGDDNTLTLSSGLMFSRKLDSVLNYSYTINKRYSNASNQTVATTFPDLTLSLMGVEEWFGLGKYLSGSRLNTGFQYTVRSNGDIDWIKPKQEMVGMSFNPLIGFTGSIMKVVNTNLSYTMTKAENTTDMETYEIIKTTDTRALNGNVSYSFRAGRGFTVPFTQKKIHIRNELTSSLAFVYENNFDETFGRDSSQIDRDSSRLAFTPGATYQFDQNIRGGLTGSYEITNDRKRDDGVRIFRLGVWVEINL